MKEMSSKLKIREKLLKLDLPLSIIDVIIFFVLAIVCFFSFQQGDLIHTSTASISYLNGDFKDFYKITKDSLGMVNYLPTIYIIFGIWNIPMRLFGVIAGPTWHPPLLFLFWNKLLVVIFYFAVAYLIYKICIKIGFGNKKAKLCMYAFIGMPIAFFNQFIFGQYDSITLFFAMLGIYFYFNDNDKNSEKKFLACFAIAMTLKYIIFFPFLIFLLLKEKNILNMVKKVAITLSLFIFETLIYCWSNEFREGVFGWGSNTRMLNATIGGYFSIAILGYLVVLMWAFMVKVENRDDLIKWSFYLCNVISFVTFGFMTANPNWLIYLVPFWIITTFLNKRADAFFALDLIFMGCFVLFYIHGTITACDEQLLTEGVFKHLYSNYAADGLLTLRMQNYLRFSPTISLSVMSGIMLINAIFKHPNFCNSSLQEFTDRHFNWARVSFFGGISIFVLPAFLCLVLAPIAPLQIVNITRGQESNIGPLTSKMRIEQAFYNVDAHEIQKLSISFGTYGRQNDCPILLELVDGEDNRVLTYKSLNPMEFTDGNLYDIKLDEKIPIEAGKWYRVRLSTVSEDINNSINVTTITGNSIPHNQAYAIVDGQEQNYNLDIIIYGKK